MGQPQFDSRLIYVGAGSLTEYAGRCFGCCARQKACRFEAPTDHAFQQKRRRLPEPSARRHPFQGRPTGLQRQLARRIMVISAFHENLVDVQDRTDLGWDTKPRRILSDLSKIPGSIVCSLLCPNVFG